METGNSLEITEYKLRTNKVNITSTAMEQYLKALEKVETLAA